MRRETREREPDMVVMELSRQKAKDIASGCPVGAMMTRTDTMVPAENETLGRPGTPMRTYEMLGKVQGRTHQVYTGVTASLCQEKDKCYEAISAEHTDIHVYPITYGEVGEYARCGGPSGKAGAYGVQGKFVAYTGGIDGGHTNVVGLPTRRLYQEVKELLEDREDD